MTRYDEKRYHIAPWGRRFTQTRTMRDGRLGSISDGTRVRSARRGWQGSGHTLEQAVAGARLRRRFDKRDGTIREDPPTRAPLWRLARRDVPKTLAGQCALASMQVAVRLGDPWILRTGFFMKVERFCGRRGRYPNRHAWCRLGETIVDPTATQFVRCRSVHITHVDAQDRYIETSTGLDALADIMDHWHGRALPEYVHLTRLLHDDKADASQPQDLQV